MRIASGGRRSIEADRLGFLLRILMLRCFS